MIGIDQSYLIVYNIKVGVPVLSQLHPTMIGYEVFHRE